jgi:nitroimidazol reductase NimA-like FMN-containing flavoprotein (pyridoxamine 5'-phosphate oxidase superfamily)
LTLPKKWLTEAEAIEYLAGKTEGRLATADLTGQPYITPLNYVYYAGKVYFHCAITGRKLENIAVNNKVCFEVSHTGKNVFAPKTCACATRYVSVLVFGTARRIDDLEEKTLILNILSEKFAAGRQYQPVMPAMSEACSVVEIVIDKISGKSNIDP